MKAIAFSIALFGVTAAHAAVTFVTSASDPAFAPLAVWDSYAGVTPLNTGQASFVSNQIEYLALTNDVGVWRGVDLASVLGTNEIPDYLVTTNGDENFRITPQFVARRIGFETFTINEMGNPLSVAGAPNVLVQVETIAGTTSLSLDPPANNHGFLGIISDDPILSVRWFGELGRVKDTGITNIRVAEAVPEPTTLAALVMGGLTILARRRRR